MNASTLRPTPAPTALPTGRAGDFSAALHSEWVKLTTVRSVRAVAGAIILSGVAGALLQALTYAVSEDTPGLTRPAAAATAAVLNSARQASQLMVGIFAVLAITSEFSTGSIRSSLLSVPRRRQLLAAKVAVVAIAVALLSAFGAAASYLAVLPLLDPTGLVASPGSPAVLRAVRTFVLYDVLVGLFSLAIGALVRHTVVAVVLVLGVLIVLPVPVAFLSGAVDMALTPFTFTSAASTVAHLSASSDLGMSVLVVFAWLVLPATLGTLSFVRRDV